MEQEQEARKTGPLRRLRLAAGAAGAAVLAGFASPFTLYDKEGDIVLSPWWL